MLFVISFNRVLLTSTWEYFIKLTRLFAANVADFKTWLMRGGSALDSEVVCIELRSAFIEFILDLLFFTLRSFSITLLGRSMLIRLANLETAPSGLILVILSGNLVDFLLVGAVLANVLVKAA